MPRRLDHHLELVATGVVDGGGYVAWMPGHHDGSRAVDHPPVPPGPAGAIAGVAGSEHRPRRRGPQVREVGRVGHAVAPVPRRVEKATGAKAARTSMSATIARGATWGMRLMGKSTPPAARRSAWPLGNVW